MILYSDIMFKKTIWIPELIEFNWLNIKLSYMNPKLKSKSDVIRSQI
jgi:hypothetical protein